MLYTALDADLQCQLIDHHVALYQSLRDLLQREDAVGLAVFYEVDTTKFPLAQFFVDDEVIDNAALGSNRGNFAFRTTSNGSQGDNIRLLMSFRLEIGWFYEG